MAQIIQPVVVRFKKLLKLKQVQFILTGGLLFVIDYLFSLSAFYIFHFEAGFASAIGFAASFIVGFSMNRNIVFKHTQQSRLSVNAQIAYYLLLAIFNVIVSSYLVQILVDNVAPIEYIKPFVVAAFAVWNYFVLNKYIFSSKDTNLDQ